MEEPASLSRIGRLSIKASLYSSVDEDMLRWLRSFGFSSEHRVCPATRGGRFRAYTDSAVEELLAADGGMSIETKTRYEDAHNISQIVLSHRRAGGVRWIAVHSTGWTDRTLAERLLDASAEFDRSVGVLKPIFASLQIGYFGSGLYRSLWVPGSSPIPFLDYEWRNYVTPEFADGRPMGNGELLSEPMFVDFGPLPFVELAERDRVQWMLEPLLPERLEVPRSQEEFGRFGVLVQAASKDNGIELPEDLRSWVASLT